MYIFQSVIMNYIQNFLKAFGRMELNHRLNKMRHPLHYSPQFGNNSQL